MRILLVCCISLIISACGSMPKHADVRTDRVATITILNAPENVSAYLDGEMTSLTWNKDDATLTTSAGTHKLVVYSGGSVIFEDNIFIQNGTIRKITVNR